MRPGLGEGQRRTWIDRGAIYHQPRPVLRIVAGAEPAFLGGGGGADHLSAQRLYRSGVGTPGPLPHVRGPRLRRSGRLSASDKGVRDARGLDPAAVACGRFCRAQPFEILHRRVSGSGPSSCPIMAATPTTQTVNCEVVGCASLRLGAFGSALSSSTRGGLAGQATGAVPVPGCGPSSVPRCVDLARVDGSGSPFLAPGTTAAERVAPQAPGRPYWRDPGNTSPPGRQGALCFAFTLYLCAVSPTAASGGPSMACGTWSDDSSDASWSTLCHAL